MDPHTGAPLPVHKSINGAIPPVGLDYVRADLWGVTLPGLPFIEGGATGPAQERALSYLFNRYPRDWQDKILTAHAQRNYSHFFLSWPDARGVGQSLDDYVADAKRIKRMGFYVCHFLRSKDWDGPNPNPDDINPVMDRLVAEGVCDLAVPAWEMSLFYTPEWARVTIDHDATRWPSVKWGIHLQEAYASYGPNGDDQGPKFWKANIAVGVKLLLYQMRTTNTSTDPAWTAGMMQARGNDVSVRLIAGGVWGLPETVSWVPFELVAMMEFNNLRDGDGRISDELTACRKGLECLCTVGPLPPSGFGNGARYGDGMWI